MWLNIVVVLLFALEVALLALFDSSAGDWALAIVGIALYLVVYIATLENRPAPRALVRSSRRGVGAIEGVVALILFVFLLVIVWHFWGDISALLRAVGL